MINYAWQWLLLLCRHIRKMPPACRTLCTPTVSMTPTLKPCNTHCRSQPSHLSGCTYFENKLADPSRSQALLQARESLPNLCTFCSSLASAYFNSCLDCSIYQPLSICTIGFSYFRFSTTWVTDMSTFKRHGIPYRNSR